ncbi:MAG: glycoside hydrolase family 88 protein [Ignavibacteria bacterium]|jgi:unsaturated rhamnogalacturonyl hydrolase
MKSTTFAVSIFIITFLFAVCSPKEKPQSTKTITSKLLTDSFVDRHPGYVIYDSLYTTKNWSYEKGLILEVLHKMYMHTGDEKYFNFIKGNIDKFVNEYGKIRTYKMSDYNIDKIKPGHALLYLYQATNDHKYKYAADSLRKQLAGQPKTPSGGFWHKKIYPNQMWLDGLYMGEPFFAEYSKMFNDSKDFDEITHEFTLVYEHTLDPETGLLYHAWDESKKQRWVNPETGTSPHFWGRAMGWYMMAIVDVLDFYPKDHPSVNKLIKILNDLSAAVVKVKDKKTNLWYQIVNLPDREGNYLESSASAMFAYAFAKGYNMGYLNESYLKQAEVTFNGLIENKVKFDKDGYVDLYGTCRSAGLGGDPYRDGSFEYYMSEPTRKNDLKGYGPFILTAMELEKAREDIGKDKTILLDNFYNNEYRKNKTSGEMEKYHYTWDDTTDSGYFELGKLFKKYGAELSTLTEAPNNDALAKSSVYIIVDPDTEKETENPNFMGEPEISVIKKWVEEGGFLFMLSNDKGNAEFGNFNNLAKEFGFKFNEVSLNKVENNNYDMGAFTNLPLHPIFSGVYKIYMKEISTLNLKKLNHTVLKKDSDAVIAFRKFGKGFVLAIGDPWLYNEYIDTRRLPESFENYKAADNLVKWILGLTTNK